MIKIFGLLLIVTISGIQTGKCRHKVEFSSRLADNFKGNVSVVERVLYRADSSGKIGGMDSNSYIWRRYDVNGMLVESGNKDAKGTITEVKTNEYYPNGLLKKQQSFTKGKITSTENLYLNEAGKCVKGEVYDSAGNLYQYFMVSDQNKYGQLLGWKAYTKDSVYSRLAIEEYDGYRQTKSTRLDPSGKLFFRSSFERDENKEIIQVTTERMMNDSLVTQVVWYKFLEFDKQGNWTLATQLNQSGRITRYYRRNFTYFDEPKK